MGRRGRLIAVAAAAAIAGAAAFAPPVRYVVDGVSMAPGLAAGDVVRSGWFPAADRWRRPRRFARWAIAAEDGTAIKRVVGLPGEQVTIRAGDLVIDGATMVKGPRLLADVGQRVSAGEPERAGGSGPDRELWRVEPREVLDDADVAAVRSHVLLPVRDVGVAAVVRVGQLPPTGFVRLRARVGSSVVSWRFTAVGRHAIVAGRLDGRLVAAAWMVPKAAAQPVRRRSCLPAGPPEHWQIAEPWPVGGADMLIAPRLAIAGDAAPNAMALEEAGLWRDVHHRAAANGREAWSLGGDEYFVLGDFPATSSDSRQWGPVSRPRLRHSVSGATWP